MNEIRFNIISPVYNASKIVEELVNQITFNVRSIMDNFEIILVEDRSKDDSWSKIELLTKKYPNLIGVKLSRNFGQHPAINEALELAKGN